MIKVICYCGKSLEDPTHAQTHQDKFLTGKEFNALKKSKIAQVKFRSHVDNPWHYLISKRIGNTFHIIGIYKP